MQIPQSLTYVKQHYSGRPLVQAIQSSQQQQCLGLLAVMATVLVWSAYFISLRSSALSPLSLLELSLFRYVIPGLLLSPLLIKRWQRIRQVPWFYLAGMVIGAGLPFFLGSAVAMGFAPVAHGSTLVPGVAPLFVTAIAVLVYKQPFESFKKLGLSAIGVGVILLLASSWQQVNSQQTFGQLIFLVASFLWAVFTICARQSGLKPLETAAVVTVPNAAMLLIYLISFGSHTWGFTQLPWQALAAQMLVQGLAVGLLASFCYGYAITRLGAELSSALGSLTPVFAAMFAYWLFAESLDLLTIIGMISTVLGVIAASGWFKKPVQTISLSRLKE
ncbi:membrane protein [Agarivorans sp. Toyoura001]|uniref:DMT family transporter n=1 Tax=Agarivorans sp. Toyoura001 TaxID=2283141 RepID=UPI0010CEBAB1|nr:DMT family transporter [Agarivorans sp. Toyoura001]GDY28308.1 membrane protein [Agarivorans sp. Toyoura001]